jgi:hypothetical protein
MLATVFHIGLLDARRKTISGKNSQIPSAMVPVGWS